MNISPLSSLPFQVSIASRETGRAAEAPGPPSSDVAPPVTGTSGPADPGALLAVQESATVLSVEERQVVAQLKRADREVKSHERAHSAAAGPYGGMPTYEFARGPDGRRYAVSGEVSIDASPEGDAEATVAKMEIVIRAALAPAKPSSQDRSVANEAKQIKAESLAELRSERQGGEKTTHASPPPEDPAVRSDAIALYSQAVEATKGLTSNRLPPLTA